MHISPEFFAVHHTSQPAWYSLQAKDTRQRQRQRHRTPHVGSRRTTSHAAPIFTLVRQIGIRYIINALVDGLSYVIELQVVPNRHRGAWRTYSSAITAAVKEQLYRYADRHLPRL